MSGIQGIVKVPKHKWSLFFIADILFTTELFIKTGMRLTAYKDYRTQSNSFVFTAAVTATVTNTVLSAELYMNFMLSCTSGKQEWIVEKAKKAAQKGGTSRS